MVDDVVVAYFCDMFKEKYKIDVRSNQKALLRLGTECEKTKKVLCGIDRTSINIDCLMDDKDVSGEMTRDALLVGLPSSGLHSNGYSLARRLLDEAETDQRRFRGRQVVDMLLEPTAIYSRLMHTLAEDGSFQAAAHITGGGLTENLPRVLPEWLGAELWLDRWQEPDIYHWIRSLNRVSDHELRRTFNMGLGMILVVAPDQVDAVLARSGGAVVGCLSDQPGVQFAEVHP